MEEGDEDYMLQIALALSMEEDAQQHAATSQPTTASAIIGAAPQPSPANTGGDADLAAALAAAFQAVAGPGVLVHAQVPAQFQQQQQPQPPPVLNISQLFPPQQQQQQHHHLLQQQQQHWRQQHQQQQPPPKPAAPAPPKLFEWAEQLGHWWQANQPVSSQGSSSTALVAGSSKEWQQIQQQQQVQVPLSEFQSVLKAMSDMFKMQVVCPAAGGEAAAGPATALRLTCLLHSGSALIKALDCDILIGTWVSRAAATVGSPSQLQLLHLAFNRMPQLPPDAAARHVVLLVGSRIAAKAAKMLEDDEDDLFFETGRTTQELLESLCSLSHPLSPAFLSAMLTTCSTAHAAACWARLLKDGIKGFATYQLTGGLTELQPLLVGLDKLTQEPRLLLQLAASLASEVLALRAAIAPSTVANLAARSHAVSSILAPLLNISSAVDALSVLQRLNGFFSSGSMSGSSSSSSSNTRTISAVAAGMSPAVVLFTSLRSYPTNAGEIEGAKRVLEGVLGAVADAVHQVAKRLASLKAPGTPAGAGREVLLSWLARVAAANEVRCRGGEYSALKYLEGAPDGFMLNLTAAILRLTKPFVSGYISQSNKFMDLFSKHLVPTHYMTHGHRLGSATAEATLSGERGVFGAAASAGGGSSSNNHIPPRPAAPLAAGSAGSSSSNGTSSSDDVLMAADPAAAAASASFIAEVFFIAQRYLRVGLLPAVNRFTKLYQQLWDHYSHSATQAAAAAGEGPPRLALPVELRLLADCSLSQLLQPDMVADATQFVVLEILWLADLVTSSKQLMQQAGSNSRSTAGSMLACIPESVLGDAAAWLTFVIKQGQAEQLAAVPIGILMQSLVVLLDNPDQVRSLLVVAKLVQLLLVMLAPQVNLELRTQGSALGRSNLTPGEMALVTSVLSTPATQQQLVPALMRVYGQADFVVGLDVDRDQYDKFSMRHQIDEILMELWRDERCRTCVRQQAAAAASVHSAVGLAAASAGTPGLFASFVSAVLNDLMYLFKDSLERLADIRQIEDSKANKEAWAALSPEARKDKETFYEGQRRTAAGFMSYALTTLELLVALTGDKDIARTFMVQPLLGRTAYAVLHFMELLVGPRCQDLAVQNPQHYHFDQHTLLLSIVKIAGQLSREVEFAQALAEEPDFDENIMQTAVSLLNAQHAYGPADMLSAVLTSVAKTPVHQSKKQRRGLAGFRGVGAADAIAAEHTKAAAGVNKAAETSSPMQNFAMSADGSSNGTAAAVAAGYGSSSDGSSPAGTKLLAGVEAEIQQLVNQWCQKVGPGPSNFDQAEQAYEESLEPLAVGVFDASTPGAYNSHFAAMAAQSEGDASQKMRRLGRELRDLRGRTRLPVRAAAACLVRQDQERPDKVRCIITGPAGTPYEGGLFVFDVYFPAGYPNVPPLMVLETTGEGRARFNPNLYADGKVCLSLLGTWHGGDEASKWNPATSSLFQILLSIQGMIFVEDPYFNEPNVELMRGTTEGNIASMRYNVDLRLSTLRWAVLALLKKPPPGLEDVVKQHFRVLRGVLVSQAGKWLRDAAAVDSSSTTYRRLVDVLHDITQHLAAL